MENYRSFKNNAVTQDSTCHDEADTDQEIQNLKSQIRGVKQDSVASTRYAISKLAESEESASVTLNKLEKQSEKLTTIDRQMELAKVRADQALDNSKELKRINKSMFSAFSFKGLFGKKSEPKKLQVLKDDIEARKAKEQEQVEETSNTCAVRFDNSVSSKTSEAKDLKSQTTDRQYLFEEDSEDIALEKELDSNLDDISSALGRLKNMSLTMSNEIEGQNQQLDRITTNATKVQTKVEAGKDLLKSIN